MRILRRKSFVLCLLALLSACTSLTDQGDELYEKGLFLEAEKTYSAALAKDPNDAEAKAGLQKARTKILDSGLIEVRMLRLGSNLLLAAEKLEWILQKQVEWQIRFTSAIAQTQDDETLKAKEFLIREMNSEAQAGFAERAHWLNVTHLSILENSGPSSELDEVKREISANAKKRCSELQEIPSQKDVFLRVFVSRYCSLFGMAWNSKNKVDDPWLFSGVTFDNRYEVEKLNYSGNLNSQGLQSDFTRAFESSPFYNPSANRILKLSMSGTLAYRDRRSSDRRRQNYEIEEERIETVTSKLADGTTREERVKKKRKIPREFHYYVTTHDESANFISTVSGSVEGKPIRSHFQNQATQSSESHNESNAAAGIRPVRASLMNVEAWYGQQSKKATEGFSKDIDTAWGQYFCSQIPENNADKQAKSGSWEMIERCGRVENSNQLVDTFYRSRFHLSYLEFWSMLKDKVSSGANKVSH